MVNFHSCKFSPANSLHGTSTEAQYSGSKLTITHLTVADVSETSRKVAGFSEDIFVTFEIVVASTHVVIVFDALGVVN